MSEDTGVRETSFLFERCSVLVQRFNAILLHDSLPAFNWMLYYLYFLKSPRDHIYVVAIMVKDTVATNVKNVRSSSRSSSTRSCSSYSGNIYLTLCSHGSSAFAELLVLKVWFWVTVAHQIWSKYYSLLLLYYKILLFFDRRVCFKK